MLDETMLHCREIHRKQKRDLLNVTKKQITKSILKQKTKSFVMGTDMIQEEDSS